MLLKDKKSPCFVLYGIGGVYNYGCEAIVRGTVKLLLEQWPDAIIKYASIRCEDDKRRLKDCSIEVIARKFASKYSLKNILVKTANMLPIDLQVFNEDIYWLNDSDVVLSIGGDIYTLKPDGTYNKNILKVGDIVIDAGKKFVIWGASVGPFSDCPKAEKRIRGHLSKTSLITSRELHCTGYLKSINISKNVVNCADPAFFVEADSSLPNNREKLKIALNLSPVVTSNSLLGLEQDEAAIIEADLIRSILDRHPDADVVLLPHVFSFNLSDDDLRHINSVYALIPKGYKSRVICDCKDQGFIAAKKLLKSCDILIASRMHCAINAIEAGVPTILLGYSAKAAGMTNYVYGTDKWYVQIKEGWTDKLVSKCDEIIDAKGQINEFLKERVSEIKADARVAVQALANLDC